MYKISTNLINYRMQKYILLFIAISEVKPEPLDDDTEMFLPS